MDRDRKRGLTFEQRFAISLGKRIRSRRKDLGYSQRELVDLINEHPASLDFYRERLSQIELGNSTPSIFLFIILSEKLNVKWEYWLNELAQEISDGKTQKTAESFSKKTDGNS